LTKVNTLATFIFQGFNWVFAEKLHGFHLRLTEQGHQNDIIGKLRLAWVEGIPGKNKFVGFFSLH
jgi:hypothetical protein